MRIRGAAANISIHNAVTHSFATFPIDPFRAQFKEATIFALEAFRRLVPTDQPSILIMLNNPAEALIFG